MGLIHGHKSRSSGWQVRGYLTQGHCRVLLLSKSKCFQMEQGTGYIGMGVMLFTLKQPPGKWATNDSLSGPLQGPVSKGMLHNAIDIGGVA